MKLLALLTLALSAGVGAFAQGNNATAFAEGFLSALRTNNLSSLADVVGIHSEALLPALQGGNKTVLAPSNQAFAALGDNVDSQTLVATIAYHALFCVLDAVLNGSISTDSIGTKDKTIASSALVMPEFVSLPRNRSQVVVLSKYEQNNTVYVELESRNVSLAMAMDGAQYENIRVQPIDQVLSIPPVTSEVVSNLGASQLGQLLQSANLVEPLDASVVTVFAPLNEPIEAAQSGMSDASAEQQTALLLNHVVNGSVIYSTSLAITPDAISASGNQLRVMTNSSGAFVNSGNITARIVESDYVAKNGVVHLIDKVLVNTTQNMQAAGSAYSSATSAAATETAAPGVGSESGSASGASGGGAGAGNGGNRLQTSGAAAAIAGMLGSAFWLLA
ncbi:hypothetical protein NDA11_005855 [Ustilago hordei]|uniref:FAS1 domain-containing protein n=1 Tax=Ustilago hordei TaxID=120017 RepID=I2FQJ3_USTHO|nr:uncharacterized protein UHO2_05244 [Ustilago hordei]KAJ1042870.1 hypothetical protein NDA10_005523 [Ustilago hordei]KAJ1571320.1 hypothetical protein NDA12_006171 [Ustilago hordei]KAJ1571510.1 hypothetical protein NDA15_004362 [Ustilago hordei]KAJ1596121.1 hypothetical protein NDA11_005855 [Ustilago hordei]KAJ1596749.1 hypothetical protein NDA14_005904 [Ustilago hordei]